MLKNRCSKRRSLMSMRLKPAVYCLINSFDISSAKVPMSPNLLTFTDKTVEKEYISRLYINPQTNQASDEFSNDLFFFYVFLTLMCLSYGIFSIVLYSHSNMTATHLIFHLVFLFSILTAAYILLFCIKKQGNCLGNIRFWFFILGIFTYSYLIISQERVLGAMFSDSVSSGFLPLSLGIVSFTIVLRIILFDSFAYILYSVLYFLALHLVLALSVHTEKATVLAEFFMIFLASAIQLIESQRLEYRSRQIFWLQTRDQRTYKTSTSMRNQNEGISSEPEMIIKSCENIQRNLKKARSVIMYQEIKDSLKISYIELESVKQKIGSALYSTEIKFEDELLDAEDKEFITQNFVDIGYRANESIQPTLVNFIEKNYPFSHYGVEEMGSLLSQIGNNWNFDIWFIQDATGASVSIVGKYLCKKWSLNDFLNQDNEKIENFFAKIENGYLDNPYHNACHAADVLHTDLYFLMQSNIKKSLTQIDLVSCIIAALGHDIGHPAITNRFLVNNRDKLALRYNDASVLESMHTAKTFKILAENDSNILSNLENEDWLRSRKLIIGMILETDMSKHFEILGKFRTRVSTLSNLDIENFEDKIQILAMGIKCADIGHSAKDGELHRKWTQLVCEEFFAQGDLEKAKGQAISMYCDRDNTDIAKSQAGFLKNICVPLYEVWGLYLQSDSVDKIVIRQLKANLDSWISFKKRRETVKVLPYKIFDLKRMKSNK